MASKWLIRRSILLRRSGVTLIETLVALGLLISLLMMWRPVVLGISRFAWRDAEALDIATFEQVTQRLVASDDTVIVKDGRLAIEKLNQEKTVKNYSGPTGGQLVYTSADNKGYEPVLTQVSEVSWEQLALGVKYTITMKSGRVYEGVIVSGEKTR